MKVQYDFHLDLYHDYFDFIQRKMAKTDIGRQTYFKLKKKNTKNPKAFNFLRFSHLDVLQPSKTSKYKMELLNLPQLDSYFHFHHQGR